MNITLDLNMKLLPFDRSIIEDILDKYLENEAIGRVTGGETFQEPNGEIKNCNIEIKLKDIKYYDDFLKIVKKIKLARGSKIISSKEIIDIGKMEGLAVHLNGTDLPLEVYKSCDVNYVVKKLNQILKNKGHMLSYYEGADDTILYFYGDSFKEMNELIKDFITSYPLCDKCQIIQIA